MAINFPNSPSNGQTFVVGNRTFQYNSTKARWEIVVGTLATDISDLTDTGGVLGSGGATVYADMTALIAATGVSNGDFGLVTANNNIYVYNGSGWYKIATVQNDSPSAITGVSGSYELAVDGASTVITAVSTDPEGYPLTWSFATSGLGSIATVGQGTGAAYAIASASLLSGTYTVNANAGALTFKPDGTEMYYVGTNTDRVSRHTLSTAWDVSTGSFVGSSPNTLSQVSNLTDVKFNNDGTKMYMADRNGATANTIYQYSLSTAWDVDTASYDNKSYVFTSVLTGDDLNCFVFNADGTAVYLAEHSPSSNIYQFTLSTAFDISTASYANKTLSLSSVASNGSVGRQYFQFTNDGTKLFLIHTFHPAGFVGKIYEYSLTTAYDISTASHTSVTYTPAGITTGRSAIAFKPDGSKMFIMGTDNHTTISQFNLPIYNDNQFVISPSTDSANSGTFTLTISTTDGINGAVSTSTSLTLNFIINVTNSRYTTLLATATGTSDNNNITDSSSNSHSITVNGDAYAGTFSPYRSGGYSTFFGRTRLNNPSGDPTEAISATLGSQIGTGDFSFSYWVYVEDPSTGPHPKRHFDLGGSGIKFYQHSNTTMRLQIGGGTVLDYATLGSLSIKSWHYVSVTRSSGTVAVHFDGILAGSTTNSTNITQTNFRLGAGTTNDITFGLIGYVRDFMIKNVAVYSITENYTVPDNPAEPDSNTLILLCSLPYHTDASSNNLTLDLYPVHNSTAMTVAPEIHTFSPYDYTEYSATDHGGSVYSDGTGDYLEFPINAIGTGDFTVECWAYLTSFNDLYDGLFSGATIGGARGPVVSRDLWWLGSNSGAVGFSNTQNKLELNRWQHVAISREGSSARAFYNGVLLDTQTTTMDLNQTTMGLFERYTGGSNLSQGYIADFRLTNGSAIYTSDFTPPTAPLSSSGTTLHIKGTDASIIDKSQGTNLKLVGNTTGSTTQVKFVGSKSMYFDGTGDRATATGVPDLGDDFTIECWVYATASGNKAIVSSIDNVGGGSSSGYWSFGLALGGSNYQLQTDVGSYGESNTGVLYNQWVHLAVTRTSNTIRYFINGTLDSNTVSNSSTLTNPSGIVIGSSPNNNYIYNFTGYIQDLRISNECKYTANFTPPTASLEG